MSNFGGTFSFETIITLNETTGYDLSCHRSVKSKKNTKSNFSGVLFTYIILVGCVQLLHINKSLYVNGIRIGVKFFWLLP